MASNFIVGDEVIPLDAEKYTETPRADPGLVNGGRGRGATGAEKGGVWGGGVPLPNGGGVWEGAGRAPSPEFF